MYRRPTIQGNILGHFLIWIFILFSIFPVLWIFSASFNPLNTIVGQTLIPEQTTLDNYRELFTSRQHPFRLWIWNSVKISLITSILSVTLTALAAYSFSRFRFRGRRNGLFIILLVQIFPQMLAMVAIYLFFLELGKVFPILSLDTHLTLIMTYLGGAIGVNTWLIKGYMDTIPRSLEESAYIDGASPFVAFYSIILPLSRPILAVVFMLIFIHTYSEFVLARVLLSSTENFTLPVGMYFFIADQYGSRWGTFAAGSILGAVPFLILFLFSQKYIISGLTRGSVKE